MALSPFCECSLRPVFAYISSQTCIPEKRATSTFVCKEIKSKQTKKPPIIDASHQMEIIFKMVNIAASRQEKSTNLPNETSRDVILGYAQN